MMPDKWIRTYEHGPDWIESRGGVEWGHEKVPGRLHRCKAQTRAWMGAGYVERCNCGATRLATDDPWMERNQTRIARRRKQAEDRKPRVTVTCRVCLQPYECAQGSGIAREELCSSCWADRLVAEHGGP
jgi:hypothetical protein